MSLRRSSIARRIMGCCVAVVFFTACFISSASTVHSQTQKSTAGQSGAYSPYGAQTPAKKTVTPAPKLAPGEKVNINSAPKEKLEALPGIGPSKAQAIIAGRPYSKPEDIMKVRGIKKGTYEKIKDLITVY